LPYLKIDPMKIDVAAVTQVVSHAYAQRYRILPVAVTDMQVVFASSEPFDTRWVADLGHILRKDIQRVVASPLDVNRYLAEWWSVQRSIQRAKDAKDGQVGSGILNFGARLEGGRRRRRRSPCRAHRRLAAAVRVRAARRTSTSNRAAT
jgi:general secretion pathway protein E